MPTATVDATPAPTHAPRANGAPTRHINDIHTTQWRDTVAPTVATRATTHKPPRHPSKWGAIMTWALLILCASASVLANVTGARANLIAQIFAGAPPVVFLACVEVILRAEVPQRFRYTAARFLGLTVVAAVSAVASYIHQVHLLASLGETWLIAHTLPAALDGAMLLASVTLLGLAEKRRQPAPTVATRHDTAPRACATPDAPLSRQPEHVATPAPTVATGGATEPPRQPVATQRATTKVATRATMSRHNGTASLINDAYTPGDTAPTVRDKLARQGHDIALRTIQRRIKEITA